MVKSAGRSRNQSTGMFLLFKSLAWRWVAYFEVFEHCDQHKRAGMKIELVFRFRVWVSSVRAGTLKKSGDAFVFVFIFVLYFVLVIANCSCTINQYQYQIGSDFSFRAEQIRRVQSIGGVALEVTSHRYILYWAFVRFICVLCNLCVFIYCLFASCKCRKFAMFS